MASNSVTFSHSVGFLYKNISWDQTYRYFFNCSLYFKFRCQDSVHFSLLCLWLLESLAVDRLRMRDKTIGHGEMLRFIFYVRFDCILSCSEVWFCWYFFNCFFYSSWTLFVIIHITYLITYLLQIRREVCFFSTFLNPCYNLF